MAGNFRTYTSALVVSVDGRLQNEECSASVSHEVGGPVRVTMTAYVPEAGFEFDPREEIGTGKEHDIKVFQMVTRAPTEPAFLSIRAKVVSWTTASSPLLSTVVFAEVPEAAPLATLDPDSP